MFIVFVLFFLKILFLFLDWFETRFEIVHYFRESAFVAPIIRIKKLNLCLDWRKNHWKVIWLQSEIRF